jgi:hypothetical protein
MNLVTAAVRRLRQEAAVTGLARIDKHKLVTDVASTGKVAVVVMLNGSWRSDRMHTARFPRLTLMIHADVTRDSKGTKIADDAEDKALAAWEAVDKVFHRTSREVEVWGGANGVPILGSTRESEPQNVTRPGQETVLMRAMYHLKTV